MQKRISRIEKKLNSIQNKGLHYIKLLAIASDEELIESKDTGIDQLLSKYKNKVARMRVNKQIEALANCKIINLGLTEVVRGKIDFMPISDLIKIITNYS